MKKRPNCAHQFDDVLECQPAFHNFYYCPKCNLKWSDKWSAECDDRCPSCDVEYTPTKSKEIAICACQYLETHP